MLESRDAEYGAGAGNAVEFGGDDDHGRRLITEMKLHVKREVTDSLDLGAVLSAGRDVSAAAMPDRR